MPLTKYDTAPAAPFALEIVWQLVSARFNCDHQFAIDLAEEIDVYDQGFHTFMGPFDYNDPANCSKIQSRTLFKAECCGGIKSAFTLFNSFGIQKCCPDGSVRNEC